MKRNRSCSFVMQLRAVNFQVLTTVTLEKTALDWIAQGYRRRVRPRERGEGQ